MLGNTGFAPARMRAVDAVPLEMEGGVMVCLRDPEGVADDSVVLSPAAFLVASLLDGARTVPQIRAALTARMEGAAPTDAEIASVVEELDARGYLETPTFRLKRADAVRRWTERSVRPASHAGQAYPGDPAQLKEFIRSCFTAEGGPGFLVAGDPPPSPRGLIVPHIDFARGGPVYAHAHKTLLGGALPELVVVLGVAHAAGPAPYVVTRKAFETPLGIVPADGTAVEALAAAAGGWIVEDDWAHRTEHSVEFQLVWLQAMHPGASFTILPVLCGAFEQSGGSASPAGEPRIAAALAGLREVLRGRRALVIASVDLSHVGPRFGDDIELNDELVKKVEEDDRGLLDHAEAGDAEAFWAAGTADDNARRVDALSAVYTMLKVLDGPPGRVLAYGMAPDPSGGLVSFASAAFP